MSQWADPTVHCSASQWAETSAGQWVDATDARRVVWRGWSRADWTDERVAGWSAGWTGSWTAAQWVDARVERRAVYSVVSSD